LYKINKKLKKSGYGLAFLYLDIDHAASGQLLSTNTYNELGQLQNKELGDNLENLAYTYNIRGWLSTINKDYVSGSSNSNYFGMELGYDKTTAANTSTSYANPQYNGNISGTLWRSAGDGVGRKGEIYNNPRRLNAKRNQCLGC
jgi:hypothetical protein